MLVSYSSRPSNRKASGDETSFISPHGDKAPYKSLENGRRAQRHARPRPNSLAFTGRTVNAEDEDHLHLGPATEKREHATTD